MNMLKYRYEFTLYEDQVKHSRVLIPRDPREHTDYAGASPEQSGSSWTHTVSSLLTQNIRGLSPAEELKGVQSATHI